jgi:hypothetical protein
VGLFSKAKPQALPPPPKAAPLPNENDAVKAREAAAKKVAKLQGSKSTILAGVLGDKMAPTTAQTILGGS